MPSCSRAKKMEVSMRRNRPLLHGPPRTILYLDQHRSTRILAVMVGGRHVVGAADAPHLMGLFQRVAQRDSEFLGAWLAGLQRLGDRSLQQQERVVAVTGEGADALAGKLRHVV